MRTLGRSGISVRTRLGLSGSYGIDAASAERAFEELAIDYFFVTPRTPALIQAIRALVARGHRDRLVIAAGANVPFGWSVRRAFDRLRKLLGVDVIDVFHLFWVQSRWYVSGSTWKEMERLKHEGHARALAISCHDRPLARALASELSLDVLMLRYNAAHRGAEQEVFATLPDPRPGVVAYTATRWGALLKPLGGDAPGPMTAPECYRFQLGHPAVDLALVGARSFDELREDVEGVALGPLPEARLAEVRAFGDRVRATMRGRIGFGGRA